MDAYQRELDKAYNEMGALLGVKHHADGAIIVKIPPLVEQQDFPPSRSIV